MPTTPYQEQVTPRQVAWMAFYFTVCVTPFALAPLLLPQIGRSAWLPAVAMVGPGLIGVWAAARLAARFPGESVLAYAPRLLGSAVGWVFHLALAVALTLGALFNLHMLVDMVTGSLLPNAPHWVPDAMALAVVTYGVTLGMPTLGRWIELQAYLLVPLMVAVVALPWLHSLPGRLLPLGRMHWGPFLSSGTGVVTLGAGRGFIPLLFLGGPSGGDRRRLLAPALLAVAAGGVVTAALLAMTIGVLGPADAAQARFPILITESTFVWRWLPLQRYGHLTAMAWVMLGVTVDALYARFAGESWAALWKGHARWPGLVVALAMLAFGLVRFAPARLTAIQTIWSWMVVLVMLGLPLLLVFWPLRRQVRA